MLPDVGRPDTDSDASEAITKVTQAPGSTDYDVEDKDVMLTQSVENKVTTDMRMPVTLATTSAEML